MFNLVCHVTSDHPITILCSVRTVKLPALQSSPFSSPSPISPLFTITNISLHLPVRRSKSVQITKSRNILVFSGEALVATNPICGTVPYRLSTAPYSAQSGAATRHICRRRLCVHSRTLCCFRGILWVTGTLAHTDSYIGH